MKKKKNETNACNAFIEIIEKLKGVKYKISSIPDEENGNTKDIDFILAPTDKKDQSPKIAVEHTTVERHEKQIDYVKQLGFIEKEIVQECQEKLPNNYFFQLIVPPSLAIGMNNKKRDKFITEMLSWIPNAAKSLTTDRQSSRLYNEHEVLLWCAGSSPEFNGTIGTMATDPEKPKKEKQDRFCRAIKDKLPKLIKYKDKGFVTALLLEDVGISHSNPGDNLDDLVPNQYRSDFQSKIDYVVIFVSNRDKMIVGLIWKEGTKIYHDIPENRRFHRFNFQQ